MKRKAIITSINGPYLTPKERNLIKHEHPWGLIIFKRNIKNMVQLKRLIKDIKKAANNSKFPILIDEEGGTVSRLTKVIKNDVSQKLIGNIYSINNKLGTLIYNNYIDKLSSLLKEIGINVNTVPVLDVLRKKTHKIIGDRSFSHDPLIVKKLGQVCVSRYQKNKIASVIKHIPGHGCATLDSHLSMPKVKQSYSILKNIDFLPFKSNKALFAMTAHILYKKIDNKNVATFSKKIIKRIIRNKIGFNGILISDDISMKALKFDIITNALKALDAGCNLVLYCSGNFKESKKLITKVPYIDNFTAQKTTEFFKFLR